MIILGAISTVSANDLNTTDVQTSIDEDIVLEQDINNQENIAQENTNQDEVLSDSPQSFSNLYELINNNSDSVIELKGNYTYNPETDSAYLMGVSVNHDVTIDGKGFTIDGASTAKGFSVNSTNVIFKNINFVHLGKYNSNSNYNGGAIYCSYQFKAKVIDSTFTDCKGYWGGAIDGVDAENCTFTGNRAEMGGAMYGGKATDCNFTGNSATLYGGACGQTGINRCNLISNNAPSGGATYRCYSANSLFKENTATSSGGAAYGYYRNDYIVNCTFISNSARNGGAIYNAQSYADVVNCTFKSNKATYRYGAVYRGYIVLCTFTGNTATNSYSNYGSSTVYTPTPTIPNTVVYYPEMVSVPVELVYKGSLNYYFDGKDINIQLSKSGTVIGTYSVVSGQLWNISLDAGAYSASLRFYPPSGSSSSGSYSITVRGNKTIIVTNTTLDVIKGSESYLVATLTNETGSPLPGFNLTVYQYGYRTDYPTDANGQIKIPLQDFDIGTYYFTITFTGKDSFENSNEYVVVNVRKTNSVFDAPNSIVIYYNESTNITATLNDEFGNAIKNQTVTVTFNGETSYVNTNEDGQVTLEIPKLNPNHYSAEFIFYENELYNGVSKKVDIIINRISTRISSENVIAYYREGKIIAKLTDQFGNNMSGVYLNLFYNGTTFVQSLMTNESGEVEFDLGDLDNGTHSATITYNGTSIYGYSTKDITLKIGKLDAQIITNGTLFIYNETDPLVVTVIGYDGPVQNAEVRIQIGPIDVTVKTDENGQAILNLTGKLPSGTYEGNISINESERYTGATIPVEVTIEKIPTEIIATNVTGLYNESKYLFATLKDKYGNPLKNMDVVLEVEGLTFSGTTDENGTAKILIDLPAKTYEAAVKFKGDNDYAASSTISKIVVQRVNKIKTKVTAKSLTTIFNAGKYLVITLKDIDGNAIANAKINVKLNGKTKVLTTNSKGQAKLSANGLVPNTYTVSIVYPSNEKYIGSSSSVKILVKKATPKITAAAKKVYTVKATKKYTLILKNNKNQVLKNHKVSIQFKGKTYTAKTNAKGQATFTFQLTTKGTYKAVIKYSGTKYYNKLNKALTVVVQ